MYTFLFIGCPLEGKRLFRLATFKGGGYTYETG